MEYSSTSISCFACILAALTASALSCSASALIRSSVLAICCSASFLAARNSSCARAVAESELPSKPLRARRVARNMSRHCGPRFLAGCEPKSARTSRAPTFVLSLGREPVHSLATRLRRLALEPMRNLQCCVGPFRRRPASVRCPKKISRI